MRMLEDGVRNVAQQGFPHDEATSKIWARELASFTFTHVPEPVPGEILNAPELWKLKRGKAMCEDGWCEELLMLWKKMGNTSFQGLKNAFCLMAKHAVLPRYQQGSLVKPILKPGKRGGDHNEYRQLSLMSVLRKRLEKVGSLMMK